MYHIYHMYNTSVSNMYVWCMMMYVVPGTCGIIQYIGDVVPGTWYIVVYTTTCDVHRGTLEQDSCV